MPTSNQTKKQYVFRATCYELKSLSFTTLNYVVDIFEFEKMLPDNPKLTYNRTKLICELKFVAFSYDGKYDKKVANIVPQLVDDTTRYAGYSRPTVKLDPFTDILDFESLSKEVNALLKRITNRIEKYNLLYVFDYAEAFTAAMFGLDIYQVDYNTEKSHFEVTAKNRLNRENIYRYGVK